MISIENAEHYIWGASCDGWRLLPRDDLSVIQERVPAGVEEVMHYHERARQFFYILDGEGVMAFDDHEISLHKGQGVEIEPLTRHQFRNASDVDVHFLVISAPSTRGDRVDV